MRRKRTSKVVWLPVDINQRLGSAPSPAAQDNASSTIIQLFTGNPLGTLPAAEEIPIVKDFTQPNQLVQPGSSLADIAQSGYRLRRIVGKLVFFVGQEASQDPAASSIYVVTAGFIIRRIGDAGTSIAEQAGQQNVSPANLQNISDPWIWRRSWVLANRQITTDDNAIAFPTSNINNYGSGNMDGPHVDAKTARIVGPEERLFLSVVCEGVNGNQGSEPGLVVLLGDIRVLASMRTNVGNRRNASR